MPLAIADRLAGRLVLGRLRRWKSLLRIGQLPVPESRPEELTGSSRGARGELTGSSRADRFGHLAQAGPKSGVSELPKETLSSAGEEDWLHSCRIVKIIQNHMFFYSL